MKVFIEGEKIEGFFVERVNRFIARVMIGDKIQIVHVANTGRMKELLVPGARVVLRYVDEPHRKTKYDLLMVYIDDSLVSIDSKLPNSILESAFKEGAIPYFRSLTTVKREVCFGKSKFDFSLSGNGENALIEAKCVTLVKNNKVASFPDAPTERGQRHVIELVEAKRVGFRTAVFFIIQRGDGVLFTPNREMDVKFADAVVKAKAAGVEFYAYNTRVTKDYIELTEELDIIYDF